LRLQCLGLSLDSLGEAFIDLAEYLLVYHVFWQDLLDKLLEVMQRDHCPVSIVYQIVALIDDVHYGGGLQKGA
jgi:hypothetical protein